MTAMAITRRDALILTAAAFACGAPATPALAYRQEDARSRKAHEKIVHFKRQLEASDGQIIAAGGHPRNRWRQWRL